MRTFSTLHERYIEAFLPDKLPGEVYENALCELLEFLQKRYPESCYIKHPHWNCNFVVPQNGPPNLQSELTFIHDIWSSAEKKDERREWRIRVENKRIVFNFCKNKIDDSGSFSEFLEFCEPIITFYQNRLAIKAFANITLNYQFKYDFKIIDNKDFCTEKWIEVKDIFTPFALTHSNVPSEFISFIPPYHWEQTWHLNKDFFLRSTLRTTKKNEPFAIFMTLSAWQKEESSSPCSLLNILFEKLKIIYSVMITDKAYAYLNGDWK